MWLVSGTREQDRGTCRILYAKCTSWVRVEKKVIIKKCKVTHNFFLFYSIGSFRERSQVRGAHKGKRKGDDGGGGGKKKSLVIVR